MKKKISYLIGCFLLLLFFFGGGGGVELLFSCSVIERKNVVPSIDKKTTAQPKQKMLFPFFFFFSFFNVFNCCLSQSLSIRLEKGDYP